MVSHGSSFPIELKVLKAHDFYKYNVGIYMWKNLERFAQNFRINPMNTRSGDYYAPSFQRIHLTQNQSIMYQAPLIWENIPLSIRNSVSLASFKRKYKISLISLYNIAVT